MKLRKYQQEAKTAILEQWRQGNKRTLLTLPTGCGKTIVFAAVIDELVKAGRHPLVLAHRDELLKQAADKIYKAYGLECAFEKAEQTCIGTWAPVAVGSVQSVSRRLERFLSDYFTDIIVDEAHHCLSDSYKKIFEHFKDCNVLGVTATPDRADKKQLSAFFDSAAYDYTMRQAIKDGFLSPIKAQLIPIDIDISGVSINGGDYAVNEVDDALMPYLDKIAESNRPAKATTGPFPFPPKVMIGLGIAVGVIFLIIIVASIFGGGDKDSEQSLVQKLNLRSTNLSRTIETYNRNVKSSKLRSMGSSLRTVLNETASRTTTILTEDFNSKKSDKGAEESEKTYIEEVNTALENAKLNGLLDRDFVREMTYQIGLILSMESDILGKTKKDNLKEFLNSSYSNLESLYNDFSEYSDETT